VTARGYLDGDPFSSARIGAAMLDRARILTSRGLVCTIKKLEEMRDEQRAAAALRMVGWVAGSCDPLCDKVAAGIADERGGSGGGDLGVGSSGSAGSGAGVLGPLLRNDLKLPSRLVDAWHSLLLTLLAVPGFKAAMANAYCDTYRA